VKWTFQPYAIASNTVAANIQQMLLKLILMLTVVGDMSRNCVGVAVG
jgi:hypothetical protein